MSRPTSKVPVPPRTKHPDTQLRESRSGRPYHTLANTMNLFETDPRLKGWRPENDLDVVELRIWASITYNFTPSEKNIRHVLSWLDHYTSKEPEADELELGEGF